MAKCLVDIIASKKHLTHEDGVLLDVLLELFIKSPTYRGCVDDEDPQSFHISLVTCLKQSFEAQNTNDQSNEKCLELVLDFVFVYFYFNRKVMCVLRNVKTIFLIQLILLKKFIHRKT